MTRRLLMILQVLFCYSYIHDILFTVSTESSVLIVANPVQDFHPIKINFPGKIFKMKKNRNFQQIVFQTLWLVVISLLVPELKHITPAQQFSMEKHWFLVACESPTRYFLIIWRKLSKKTI